MEILDDLEALLEGYRESSTYAMEIGNVDGAKAYDRAAEELEKLIREYR